MVRGREGPCTLLSNTLLYCTVLYSTVQYFTVLYCTVLYCTILYCTLLYNTVLYCTILYCTVLYCTVLYCTILSCTVLQEGPYSTLLYCRRGLTGPTPDVGSIGYDREGLDLNIVSVTTLHFTMSKSFVRQIKPHQKEGGFVLYMYLDGPEI